MMWRLIQLEWKKHTIWKYIRNAVIVTVTLLGVMMLIGSDPDTGKIVSQTGKSELHSLTELFLNMVYLVFTGIMLSTFVIGEYENKLINLMFSYPIKRQKIVLAKVLAVCIFNFIALFLSKLFICTVLAAVKGSDVTGISMGDLLFWMDAVWTAFVSVCSGCFSLLIGMKMKSSKAAVISSFVIMLAVMGATQGNVLSCTSADSMIAYAAQIVGACMAVFLSTRRIEAEDVN